VLVRALSYPLEPNMAFDFGGSTSLSLHFLQTT
jgi:hypothetical protein